MDIGNKVREIRKARGLTQQDVADKMGLKKNTISQWESGARSMSLEQTIQFAKVVGVTLDYFSDHSPERTMFQLMAQLESVFTDAGIPEVDKDKAYQDIMRVYLKSKEQAADRQQATNPSIDTEIKNIKEG